MKIITLAALVLMSAGAFAQTTTCTPTFGGGQTCTTRPDPMQQLQEQFRQQQQQAQEQQRQQQEQLQRQQQLDEQRRQSCQHTTYSRNPYTGQLESHTAPCW